MKSKINKTVTVLSTAIVILVAVLVVLDPKTTTVVANNIFNGILSNLDWAFLIGTLLALLFLVYLMISKYGKLRLGKEAPDFSMVKIFNMVFCSSFGASALYWCFTEVMFYYNSPPFGIEAGSIQAAEYGLAYNFFHWGPSAWALYGICAVPFIYTFYLKGHRDFSLSASCRVIYGRKWPRPLAKAADVLFIFACIGLGSISLGLAVPLISTCICALTGLPSSLVLNISIIAGISIIFTISASLGLKKGVSKLSDINVIIFIVILLVLFFCGSPRFTLEYATDSFGIMLRDFFRMSLHTDPLAKSGFPQSWTVFYWAYWMVFGPGMGVFIARISKGQRLKTVMMITLIAGPAGGFAMQAITQSYVMKMQTEGIVNAAEMVANGQGNELVVQILKTTPFPMLAIVAFAIVAIIFMATTMDSNAFTLASVASEVDEADNPPQSFRLYWCAVSALIPLALIAINAELDTIKTIALIIAVPLGIIFLMLNVRLFKNMKKQFGNMTAAELEEYLCDEDEAETGK